MSLKDKPQLIVDERGVLSYDKAEPVNNLVTWVFNEGTFIPQAKIVDGKTYSIVTDHLGTPFEAYNEEGEKVWSCELDIYGKTSNFTGNKTFIPFRYQGQYDDGDTELYYNRFRYYSPESGTYISQDPIGLAGSNPNFYAYVPDVNSWVDIFGLDGVLTIFSNSPVGDPIGHSFVGVTEGGVTKHLGQWPGGEGFGKGNLLEAFSGMDGQLIEGDVKYLNSKGTVSKSFNLDDAQMVKVNNFIKEFDSKNLSSKKGYNLINRQCASFAYGVAKAAGLKDMKMPWYKWVTPSSLHNKINKMNH